MDTNYRYAYTQLTEQFGDWSNMDLALVTSAVTGLKFGKDLISALIDAKADAASQQKVFAALAALGDIQDSLFKIREELFRLQFENEKVRKKNLEYEKWDQTLMEYKLVKTEGHAVVYESNAQPQHFLCPSCITLKQLQILQDNRTHSGKFRCPGCKNEYPINARRRSAQAEVMENNSPF